MQPAPSRAWAHAGRSARRRSARWSRRAKVEDIRYPRCAWRPSAPHESDHGGPVAHRTAGRRRAHIASVSLTAGRSTSACMSGDTTNAPRSGHSHGSDRQAAGHDGGLAPGLQRWRRQPQPLDTDARGPRSLKSTATGPPRPHGRSRYPAGLVQQCRVVSIRTWRPPRRRGPASRTPADCGNRSGRYTAAFPPGKPVGNHHHCLHRSDASASTPCPPGCIGQRAHRRYRHVSAVN